MCRPRTRRAARALAAAAALGALLGGCSDIYYDRRETIALSGNDAVAANLAASVVDPWPAQSQNSNIAFNGERMARAVECYRKNRVTAPTDLNPSTSTGGGAPALASQNCQGAMAPGSLQPAIGAPDASVK